MYQREQLYLVSYDISRDKIRNKVASELENYGKRVQYSVFECELTESKLKKLYAKLLKLCAEEGNIRIYMICENCRRKTRMIGEVTETIKKESVIIV